MWFSNLPILSRLAADTKRVVEDYSRHRFIEGVRNGEVIFHTKRKMARQALKGVKVQNAAWMESLLSRLSTRQLHDALRAGGSPEPEPRAYLRAFQGRLAQLRRL